MFPDRYFPTRFFPDTYYAKVGADPVEAVVDLYRVAAASVHVPGAVRCEVHVPGAVVGEVR